MTETNPMDKILSELREGMKLLKMPQVRLHEGELRGPANIRSTARMRAAFVGPSFGSGWVTQLSHAAYLGKALAKDVLTHGG